VGGQGIYYGSGKTGPRGDVRSASWSPDCTHVVFHKRLNAPRPTWRKMWTRDANYELTLTQTLRSFDQSGARFAMTGT
jgi:hypothetical protein